MPHKRPPEPWDSFLRAIDKTLVQPVELRCIGGFAIAMLCGLPRPTIDIDFLTVVPVSATANLTALAGKGSALHATHGVYAQHVGIATVPENFEQRLKPNIDPRQRTASANSATSATVWRP